MKSQERDTNNPGAQMEMGPEEILLLISRDPAKTRERLEVVKARREAEARKKVAEDAARLLRSVNARFRKAERTADPAEAARLRLEAEERLKDLAAIDPEAWPWARWSLVVREQPVLVPAEGQAPVFEGLRIGMPSKWNPDVIEHAEFGRVEATTIGARQAGSAQWVTQDLAQIAALGLEPGHLEPDWPDDDDARTEGAIAEHVQRQLRYSGSWPSLGWTMAADAWLARTWERFGGRVIERMAEASSWYADRQKVPVVIDGTLQVGSGRRLLAGFVLPPTLAGWQRFLELAPASELKFTELAQAGTYWWDRKIPRDLLSAARKKEAA